MNSSISPKQYILNNNPKHLAEKASKIHMKLLSFVLNEINEKIKYKKKTFDFSVKESIIKNEDENGKNKNDNQNKNVINDKKLNNRSFNNYDDDDEEEESSSDMSCSEDFIINI